jgi:HK97 family phage major capsid protein
MVLRAFFYLQRRKMEDDVILFGGELKALGNGKVGGVLVRMTDQNTPDLAKDFFSAKSDVRFQDTLDVYYNHGKDVELKKRVIGTSKLSRMDNFDIWAETQLNMRDEYERRIYEMAEAGKLGYSSGALSHLVEREPAGKAFHIKTWVIGEVSLTPTPAEYRNTVQTIKSIFEPLENNKMSEPIVDVKSVAEDAVKTALAQRDAEQKAEAARLAEIKAAKDEGYQAAVKEIGNKAPSFHKITSPTDSPEEAQVKSFRHWMQSGEKNSDLIEPTDSMKAAMAIGVGGTGLYLVPDPLYAQISEKRNLASWVRRAPVQRFSTAANHLLVPTEDTSLTAFVATSEAAAYNENEPTVAQVDMTLTKYTKLLKASEEFVNYEATNFDQWLIGALARAEAVTENTLATAVLMAGATSSGITTASATAVTIPELASVAGKLSNGYNVPGEVGWIMKNATEWYLKGVFGTNYYAFDGLFNQPVYISDDMDAIAATKKPIIFGNFNYFGLIERPGMVVQRNPYLYMASGQIGIFATIFRGFNVLQSEAFYYLNTHA